MGNPTCFISYSWDSAEHKAWVRKLASELQRNGVETHLDQWDTHLGLDLTKYFETCIRESDFVLLICTPLFAKKANAGSGGVGYEKMVVTGEIFQKIASPKKFVPILRAGSRQESLPSFLKSRFALDFRNDNEFEQQMEDLLRHIHQVPKYVKPQLGAKPSFSEKTFPAVSVPRALKKTSFHTFKDVYLFAYSITGMNLDRDSAKEFAINWFREFSDKDFAEFKQIYSFAYSITGMNLDRDSAKEFAINEIKKRTSI